MKKYVGIIALLLAAAMLFSACSATNGDDDILAKIGDREISLSDFNTFSDFYLSLYGIDTSDTSESTQSTLKFIQASLLYSLINNEVAIVQAEKEGLTLSDEEKAEVEEYVEQTMEEGRTTFESQAKEENPDATESEIDLLVTTMMTENGYIEESIRQSQTESALLNKIYASATEGVSISDDELQKGYDEKVASAKETYDADPASYENEATEAYSTIYYVPQEARRVQQILIGISDEDKTQIDELTADGKTEEADALLQEALAKIKGDAESVLDQISDDGSNFEDLMKEHSDDTSYEQYTAGYYVVDSEDSMYESNFKDAAFDLKNVGDVSGLVPTDYGYHILRLEEIIPAGAIPLDSVKAELTEELLASKQETTFIQMIEEWKKDINIELHLDLIDMTQEEYDAIVSGEDTASEDDAVE